MILAFTQAACLKTRGMLKEDQAFDIESGRSAPGAASRSADSYLIDELKAEIARLNGRIEELERAKSESEKASPALDPRIKAYEDRIVELEKAQMAIIEAIKSPKSAQPTSGNANATSPSEPSGTDSEKSTFERGKAFFEAGKLESATETLGQFLSTVGKSKSAQVEEALQLLGESHFLLKQYQAAIVEYSKIQEKFPKSKKIPAALLRIAQSFEAMGFSEDARGFYQELGDRFPKSPEAKKIPGRHQGGKNKSQQASAR
jgi:TolA-binding protein